MDNIDFENVNGAECENNEEPIMFEQQEENVLEAPTEVEIKAEPEIKQKIEEKFVCNVCEEKPEKKSSHKPQRTFMIVKHEKVCKKCGATFETEFEGVEICNKCEAEGKEKAAAKQALLAAYKKAHKL